MPVLRSERTYPLALKGPAQHALNNGITAAYDYQGDPNNAYAKGNGVPHVGSKTYTAPTPTPPLVAVTPSISGRDMSAGKTTNLAYKGAHIGSLGFGSADGKGAFTIHRRFRTPSVNTGTFSVRLLTEYRDSNAAKVVLQMVETASFCHFQWIAGLDLPANTARTNVEFRVPYNSVVDLHLTRDGDTLRYYINGTQVATATSTTLTTYNTDWAGLATQNGVGGASGGNPCDIVFIDETYWNRALSASEVTQHTTDPYAGYQSTAIVPDGITLTNPTTGSRVNNEGFTIGGTYAGSTVPTAIEARFNNGAWFDLDTTISGGVFDGTSPPVEIVTGPVSVRFKNAPTIMATADNISAQPPTPTVAITSQQPPNGQSLTLQIATTRATSVEVTLEPTTGSGGVKQGPLPFAVTNNAVTAVINGIPAGGYSVVVRASGAGGAASTNGTTFSILGVTGGGEVITEATAATVPSAPTNVTAVARPSAAIVSFTPGADGGAEVTQYRVTASTGQTAVGEASPIRVTVANGVPVTFTVRATNSVGNSAESVPSNTVSAANTPPSAPTGVLAVAGNASVSVSFNAPADNGGASITSYTVLASTGQTATGSASPVVVAIPNGTTATFTVKATNNVGTSAASAASLAVTPSAPIDVPVPKRAVVKLHSAPNVPAANLTNLKWAWHDQPTPDLFSTPTDKGSTGTTDAEGNFSVVLVNSLLAVGAIGSLTVSNSDGTVATLHQAFCGPVGVT